MKFIFPLLLIVLAVAVAGCGSSDKSSAPAAETSAADTSAANNSGSSGGSSSGGSLKGSNGDCVHLAELSQKFSKAIASANPSGAGDVKAQIDATAKAFQQFANEAPGAVKNDFKVFAAAFASYADALSGVHLSSGQTPSAADIAKLQAASQKLNSADLQHATTHLTAWAQKNCGTAFGTK